MDGLLQNFYAFYLKAAIFLPLKWMLFNILKYGYLKSYTGDKE